MDSKSGKKYVRVKAKVVRLTMTMSAVYPDDAFVACLHFVTY